MCVREKESLCVCVHRSAYVCMCEFVCKFMCAYVCISLFVGEGPSKDNLWKLLLLEGWFSDAVYTNAKF